MPDRDDGLPDIIRRAYQTPARPEPANDTQRQQSEAFFARVGELRAVDEWLDTRALRIEEREGELDARKREIELKERMLRTALDGAVSTQKRLAKDRWICAWTILVFAGLSMAGRVPDWVFMGYACGLLTWAGHNVERWWKARKRAAACRVATESE